MMSIEQIARHCEEERRSNPLSNNERLTTKSSDCFVPRNDVESVKINEMIDEKHRTNRSSLRGGTTKQSAFK